MPIGIFFRLESNTQTREDALLQTQSRQIWGRPARGSNIPSVKAYRGSIPVDRRGIEFKTTVDPHKGSGTPFEPRWYYPHTAGVELRQNKQNEDCAVIPADVTNLQP
jgi:hypothetical protein